MEIKADEAKGFDGFIVEGYLASDTSNRFEFQFPPGQLAAKAVLNIILWKGRVWGLIKGGIGKRLLKTVSYGSPTRKLY